MSLNMISSDESLFENSEDDFVPPSQSSEDSDDSFSEVR